MGATPVDARQFLLLWLSFTNHGQGDLAAGVPPVRDGRPVRVSTLFTSTCALGLCPSLYILYPYIHTINTVVPCVRRGAVCTYYVCTSGGAMVPLHWERADRGRHTVSGRGSGPDRPGTAPVSTYHGCERLHPSMLYFISSLRTSVLAWRGFANQISRSSRSKRRTSTARQTSFLFWSCS